MFLEQTHTYENSFQQNNQNANPSPKGVKSVLRMEKIDLNVPPSLLTFAHATTIDEYVKEPLDPIIYELPSSIQTPFFLERDLENDRGWQLGL